MLNTTELILLTGASGCVGGRLLRSLEKKGYRVRCLARRPEVLDDSRAGTDAVSVQPALDPRSRKIRDISMLLQKLLRKQQDLEQALHDYTQMTADLPLIKNQ